MAEAGLQEGNISNSYQIHVGHLSVADLELRFPSTFKHVILV